MEFIHMRKPGEARTIQQYRLEMQDRSRNITDGRWLREASRGPQPIIQSKDKNQTPRGGRPSARKNG